ncbi:hypothetical protein BOTBODRAFT_181450 [Botryobasidium botryosum FD-172 SS1]|uniref:Protein kinase domain-containing protein n=1 Tax=Botryobasidium botryosum (strain FD-172 SS1) TaxID=930990 RepID=A0A067LTF2_BOTB1|nr:hypothetical protein BOTBODRAFT_181450 [Botryobasidium botryosum FD-172 SS1]
MPTSSVIPHPRRRLITPLHKPNLALRLTDTALDASWFSRWTVHEGDARTRELWGIGIGGDCGVTARHCGADLAVMPAHHLILGKLTVQTVISHATQLLECVAFLHAHGFAHCNLKLDNVVDLRTGRLFIIDYELAVARVETEDEVVYAWACGRVLESIYSRFDGTGIRGDVDSAQLVQVWAVRDRPSVVRALLAY